MNRIDGFNPLATSRTLQGNGAQGVGDSEDRTGGPDRAASRQDEVNLSYRGRFVAEASRAVANAPEIRADKVAALRAAIANGNYESNPRQVAARLLSSGTFGD